MLNRGVIPLYHQLRELLTDKIESGAWQPGYQLPTENELAAEFSVSRTTVRQTMQLLQNQGLVERIQGKGTYVSRAKVAHNLLGIGGAGGGWTVETTSKPTVRVQEILEVAPSPVVASKLLLRPGETVFELPRAVYEDDTPLALITSWFPARLFPGMAELDVEVPTAGGTVRDMLRKHFSTEIVHQHKELVITILDDEEARRLHCQPGAPALLITYLSRKTGGEPIEFRRWLIRGDRCKVFLDVETPEAFS